MSNCKRGEGVGSSSKGGLVWVRIFLNKGGRGGGLF